MKKILLILLATTLCILADFAYASPWFGGVTDPGLFAGEVPWSWPDQLFGTLPFKQATASDSVSAPHLFDGAWPTLQTWMNWVNQNGYLTTWYGGWAASYDGNGNYNRFHTPSDFEAYVAQAASQPQMQESNIYINYANEPMHATGEEANNNLTQFMNVMGGHGATGYDWLINVGKLFRKYFPNAKIGINDFVWASTANDMPSNLGTNTHLGVMIQIVQALKNAGVIDWVGEEGYGLESVAPNNLTDAINQMAGLGVGIIFTEFSPNAHAPDYSGQLAAWQKTLPNIAKNPNVIGVTGPWTFRRSSQVGNSGIVDDRTNPVTYSATAKWLQKFVPANFNAAALTPHQPRPRHLRQLLGSIMVQQLSYAGNTTKGGIAWMAGTGGCFVHTVPLKNRG